MSSLSSPTLEIPKVAIAILHHQNQFLLQLRDDDPNIAYPGHWGFFGGHLEPGETPEVAVQRELLEEIGYSPPQLDLFRCYSDANVIRYVFHGALTVGLESLILTEGLDMALLTLDEIQQGQCFSTKVGEMRPLGTPHQKILIEFIEEN